MSEFFKWLSINPFATNIVLILASVVVLSVVLILFIALLLLLCQLYI